VFGHISSHNLTRHAFLNSFSVTRTFKHVTGGNWCIKD